MRLTPLEKGCLRCMAAGGLWTQQRLVEAGYLVDSMCKLCGVCIDTIYHRLYECSAVATLRGEAAKPDFLREAIAAGPGDPLYTRGLFAHPADRLPLPTEATESVLEVHGERGWETVGSAAELGFKGEIFTDGSFRPHMLRGMGRAGWGAVMVDDAGSVMARAYGPVWLPLPQTAPSAEWAAYSVVCQLLVDRGDLFLDCQSVINMLRKARASQLHHGHIHAGYVRASLGEVGRQHISAISKVRAHQDLGDSSLSGRELALARANDSADRAAKLGAGQHRTPGADLLAEADRLVEVSTRVLKLAARLLPLWPAAKGFKAARQQSTRVLRQRGIAAHLCHKWEFMEGNWHCVICSAMACSDARVVARVRERCPGFNSWFRQILLDNGGHQLAVGDARGLALVACVSCGCWATTKPVGLLEPCLRVPTAAGKHALGMLGKGLHPVFKTPLDALWSISLATELAFKKDPPDEAPEQPAQGGVSNAQVRLAALRRRVLARLGVPE